MKNKFFLTVVIFTALSTFCFAQSVTFLEFNGYPLNPNQWTATDPKILDENSLMIFQNGATGPRFKFQFKFELQGLPYVNDAFLFIQYYKGDGTYTQVQWGSGSPNPYFNNGEYTLTPFNIFPDNVFEVNPSTPKFRFRFNYSGGDFYSPWYFFAVDPAPLPVSPNNVTFASNSPLSCNTATPPICDLNFSWEQVPNPFYGKSAQGGQVLNAFILNHYVGFRSTNNNDNEVFATNDNLQLQGTMNFNGATSSEGTKRYKFFLKTKNNLNIYSGPSNNCFAYDSFKKGSNPANPTPNFPYNLIDIGKNAVFNGWFNITNAFGLNVGKLFLEDYTKLFVSVGGTFVLAFQDIVCGVGSELIVDGGTLYLNNSSSSAQSYGCSDLTNPYAISCFAVKSGILILDADINFENGSFLLVNDNLNISQNRTIRIKTGSKLVVGENANFTYGTGASIILEAGSVLEIDGIVNVSTFQSPNLIMQNGSSFRLKDDAKLISDLDFTTDKNFELGNLAEIIVNNNFTATNSIFTKSNSATNWRGFLVKTATAILNLTNCSIGNAQIGVYGVPGFISIDLNNCTINDNIFGVVARYNGVGSLKIKNCEIYDNSYGIYCDLSGYAEIDGSEIYNNQKGIYTTVRGFITTKNTNIYDNTNYGAVIAYQADAFFGSELEGGQNRFFNNGTWDILHDETSTKTIFAQNNFWLPNNGQAGNCNTNGNNCYDENLAAINGCAAVKTYPNADCISGYAVNSQEINDLLSAFESESNGDFALAETKFMNFITNYPSSNYWSTALSGIVRNKKAQDENVEIIPFLENLILGLSGERYYTARELLLLQFVVEENFIGASEIVVELLNAYNGTENEILALLENEFFEAGSGLFTKLASSKSLDETTAEGFLSSLLREKQPNKVSENKVLPTNFNLRQNYPNPFNPNTTIEFSLPTNAKIELEIFNTLGQKVRTLASKNFEAGTHNVTWNGTDENGKAVSSGIYFYQLKTENFSETKKMVLLK